MSDDESARSTPNPVSLKFSADDKVFDNTVAVVNPRVHVYGVADGDDVTANGKPCKQRRRTGRESTVLLS